jgi:anti-anti-sigma factor
MFDGDVAIVIVSGELDFAHRVKLAPELNAALRSTVRAIVIDLEAVSLVASSGIAHPLTHHRAKNLPDRAGCRSSYRSHRDCVPSGRRHTSSTSR